MPLGYGVDLLSILSALLYEATNHGVFGWLYPLTKATLISWQAVYMYSTVVSVQTQDLDCLRSCMYMRNGRMHVRLAW